MDIPIANLPAAPSSTVYLKPSECFPTYGRFRSPVRRQPGGKIELVLLPQPTTDGKETIISVPDALGIHGDSQIGLSRARRILSKELVEVVGTPARLQQCSLCEAASRQPPFDRPTLTKDNPRPFGPWVHKVLLSREHVDQASAISPDMVEDAWEQFHELASTLVREADGLTIGMNFGEYARSGASQPHFHYQVAGLGRANHNAGDLIGWLCRAYRDSHDGSDYLEDYRTALLSAGLVVDENEHGVAYAPIAPRFKGEIQIMAKDPRVGNIRDASREQRRALAHLEHGAIRRFARMQCRAFNEVWYMTRFSTKNDCGQRLILSLSPRTSVLAFYELSGNYVIDVMPWDAAEKLRTATDVLFFM